METGGVVMVDCDFVEDFKVAIEKKIEQNKEQKSLKLEKD